MDDAAPKPKKLARPASFAVPRAAINALIDAQADAITIGAYLTLACHTDRTGEYSTASLKAIREHLNVNLPRAKKAIAALCSIQAKVSAPTITAAAPKKRGKQSPPQTAPIVYTRDAWLALNRGTLPDGPNERFRIRHVLPTFDEPLKDRVWFGSGLVRGDADIETPLLELKQCGAIAARLLLAMYAGHDTDRWYGMPPDRFPWSYYKNTSTISGAVRGLYADPATKCGFPWPLIDRINPKFIGSKEDAKARQGRVPACWDALGALESSGFIYPAVVLLDHNPVPKTSSNGATYGDIHADADIVCDLGSPSPYGPLSPVEQGLGARYVQTAAELELKAVEPPEYLAVIPTGQPGMIAGIYRLRFRVTDPKNAFIEESLHRQLKTNTAALRKLNYLRKLKKLASLKHGD